MNKAFETHFEQRPRLVNAPALIDNCGPSNVERRGKKRIMLGEAEKKSKEIRRCCLDLCLDEYMEPNVGKQCRDRGRIGFSKNEPRTELRPPEMQRFDWDGSKSGAAGPAPPKLFNQNAQQWRRLLSFSLLLPSTASLNCVCYLQAESCKPVKTFSRSRYAVCTPFDSLLSPKISNLILSAI